MSAAAQIGLFLMGAMLGAIGLAAVLSVISKKSAPGRDIERRAGKGCRRRRFATAAKVDQTVAHFRSGALTYPQAAQRLRDQETPPDTAARVLGKPLRSKHA